MQRSILTLNAGSSSIKFAMFEPQSLRAMASGELEPIGASKATLTLHHGDANSTLPAPRARDHAHGLELILETLRARALLPSPDQLAGVGHRVVHGGEHFAAPVIVDDVVAEQLEAINHLAPLHNPIALAGIQALRQRLPSVPQVAVFDTGFHHHLPEPTRYYALPLGIQREHGIRRYGFHGLAHASAAKAAAEFLRRPMSDLKLLTLHLGNGASACAIRGGRSVDTSMGFTPLEGLVMGTRAGDLDPALPGYLAERLTGSNAAVATLLQRQSGLLGLCGQRDMRRVEELADAGDAGARLALDMFCYRARKYVGAYFAVLNGIDALVFSGGIGRHSVTVRARICAELDALGIAAEHTKNASVHDGVVDISPASTPVRVLVVSIDEEREIASATRECLARNGALHSNQPGATHERAD